MNTKNIQLRLKDFPTFLVGPWILFTNTKKKQHKFILKVTRLAQKVKLYFKSQRTVVFLNIDYNSHQHYYMTQLYLVLLKNMRQVKETQINNLCMMLLKNIQNKI